MYGEGPCHCDGGGMRGRHICDVRRRCAFAVAAAPHRLLRARGASTAAPLSASLTSRGLSVGPRVSKSLWRIDTTLLVLRESTTFQTMSPECGIVSTMIYVGQYMNGRE